jgi:hypothetical protein
MGGGSQLLARARQLLSAARSNLYYPNYPTSDRGALLVVFNGLAARERMAVANLIREFVLKRITSPVPKGANRQP